MLSYAHIDIKFEDIKHLHRTGRSIDFNVGDDIHISLVGSDGDIVFFIERVARLFEAPAEDPSGP